MLVGLQGKRQREWWAVAWLCKAAWDSLGGLPSQDPFCFALSSREPGQAIHPAHLHLQYTFDFPFLRKSFWFHGKTCLASELKSLPYRNH